MFYIYIDGQKTEIAGAPVFTQCPECGKEHEVDLVEEVFRQGGDLHNSIVYCEECSARHLKEK